MDAKGIQLSKKVERLLDAMLLVARLIITYKLCMLMFQTQRSLL
jgi:hypothetical protein